MNEKLLQFIWQFSLYAPQNLFTHSGEPVVVIHPGSRNQDAGPDFLEAKIKIGTTTLVGHVELHVHSSDWKKHKHDEDNAYDHIILHVVYRTDMQLSLKAPELELGPAISNEVIMRYTYLLQTTSLIPCENQHRNVNELTKQNWQQRMLVERWDKKLTEWRQVWSQIGNDWRVLLYYMLASNFGFKINSTPFLILAKSLSINTIAKIKGNLLQTEALFFGQSGILQSAEEDEYILALKNEYAYLSKKYQLTPLSAHLWKYMRIRPHNFPTIRLSQFSQLVHQSFHLFTNIIREADIQKIRNFLEVETSDYWQNHFKPGIPVKKKHPRRLGADSIDNIIINTIAPIRFLYGIEMGEEKLKTSAFHLLEQVKAENNKYTRAFSSIHWPVTNAAESQSLLQLFQSYCSSHRCLECAVGLSILKNQGH